MAAQNFKNGGPFYEHTRILISLHSDQGFDGYVGEGKDSFAFITSLRTHKGMGDAAGSWSLSVKIKPGMKDLLDQYADPEDVWINIYAQINGQIFHVMLGVVDSISRRRTTNPDGAVVTTYTLSGKDFGKCFEKLELFVNFWPTQGPPVPQFVSYSAEAAARNLPLGSPDEVIRGLIEIWLGNVGMAEKQWMLPSSLRGPTGARYFFDLLNLGNISRNLRGQLANDPTLLSPDPLMGRSLWDVMQEYSHNLLNELWVDLAPDPDLPRGGKDRLDRLRPSVFLRERPFPTIKSTRRWNALKRVDLFPNDVKDHNLVSGDGGASRFNWWEIIPNGISSNPTETQALMQNGDGKPGGMPIYNLDSIRRHGLRRYAQTSKYLALPAGERGDPSFLAYATRWIRIVHDWYATAPFQKTGSLSLTRMRPDIRIGMRIREVHEDGDIWNFYIEDIEHSYSYPGDGETVLTVTRGERERESLLYERVYAYYRGVDLSTLSDSEVAAASSMGASPTDPDSLPTPSADPSLALPAEADAGGPSPSGVGAAGSEVVVIEDAFVIGVGAEDGVHELDGTTDAEDGAMVSPPEDVEDTDITPPELEGSGANGSNVIELDEVVIGAEEPTTPSPATRRGQENVIELDEFTIVGEPSPAPSGPSTRGGS